MKPSDGWRLPIDTLNIEGVSGDPLLGLTRHASTTASPQPSSISMIRNFPMISSAVYRFRAIPPSFRQPEILTPDLTWFKEADR
jgi:hypothetical protein